jgi:biotin operon repressor
MVKQLPPDEYCKRLQARGIEVTRVKLSGRDLRRHRRIVDEVKRGNGYTIEQLEEARGLEDSPLATTP